MSKGRVLALYILSVFALGLLGLLLSTLFPPPGTPPPSLPPDPVGDLYMRMEVIVSLVNTGMILPLLFSYVKLYREIGSRFTLALILLMLVLLLDTLTSNPVLHTLFGFRAYGIGPFGLIPDLFTTAALMVLVYLNLE